MQQRLAKSWRVRMKHWAKYLLVSAVIIIYARFIPSAAYYYKYYSIDEIESDLQIFSQSDSIPPICPLTILHLDRWAFGDSHTPDDNYFDSLTLLYNESIRDLEPGGRWKPSFCTSLFKIAIIVPYRNRDNQLKSFLMHMHQFLKPQLVDYTILIIEQVDNLPFNRGALLNVGFLESIKVNPNCHCFIFHDVDLLPMDGANLYACSRMPRHMSVSVNTFRFNLPFTNLFGGVVAMTTEHFHSVNGFSNRFYGWGGEDDDMFNRITNKGYEISRWSPKISRYHMLSHAKEVPNQIRFQLLNEGRRLLDKDGLNNLAYTVNKIELKRLCILISVSLR